MTSHRIALDAFDDDEDSQASINQAWGEYHGLTHCCGEAHTKGRCEASTISISDANSYAYGPETFSGLSPGEFIVKLADQPPSRGRDTPPSLRGRSRTRTHAESTTHTHGISYTSGISRSCSWASSRPPADWYFTCLIDDLEVELTELCRLGVYSKQELRAHCGRLVAVLNRALAR
jgi:hypothetical protein